MPTSIFLGDRYTLPNGPDAFGLLVGTTIANIRAQRRADTSMPTFYRFARIVSEQKSPIYTAQVRTDA